MLRELGRTLIVVRSKLAEPNASLAGFTPELFLLRSKVPIAAFSAERSPLGSFGCLDMVLSSRRKVVKEEVAH